MSSTPINYSLRGLAPLYILPQSFLNCFILKKTLENTKSLKNPHPDSNIVQEVRHSCAMNHMQAIRMLFQCSAKDMLNQFVQFKKKKGEILQAERWHSENIWYVHNQVYNSQD